MGAYPLFPYDPVRSVETFYIEFDRSAPFPATLFWSRPFCTAATHVRTAAQIPHGPGVDEGMSAGELSWWVAPSALIWRG